MVLIGGSILLGRKLVRTGIANIEENKSADTLSPSNFAKRIKMSFDNDGWWGTDEEALRVTLKEIPNQLVFKEVLKSYQRLYNSPLMKDMEDELTSSEFAEMTNIINGKLEKQNAKTNTQNQYISWAKRLKAAFDYTNWGMPATDEDNIKAVFSEIPSQVAFNYTSNAFKSMYGNDLISALKSELEFWEYSDYMKIILTKPQQ